jgi:predicted ATPase
MGEIHSIRIRRFKSLREVALDLDDATVFVGGNNSGKSSVLQALHFVIAVAQSSKLSGDNEWTGDTYAATFRPERLIYIPSEDFMALGHNGQITDDQDNCIEVDIALDDQHRSSISVGRDANGNVSLRMEGRELGQRIQDISRPYTVYVPGLSGIAREEGFLSQGVIRRVVARGDANLALRNVLRWLFNDGDDWEQFKNDIRELFPGLDLRVEFYDPTDEHIRVTFQLNNELELPLDCAGTGILQATQILAYINLFKPRLLLLDEPDSHMHPNNQATICALLLRLARERDFQVIVASHSRHVVAAVRDQARIVWIAQGAVVEGASTNVTALLLGLGALDSLDYLGHPDLRCVVLTEDSDTALLQSVLESSGFNMAQTQILPYRGCTKTDAVVALGGLLSDRAPNVRVVVHRDADYLPAADLDRYTERIRGCGCTTFVTDTNDIEGYFLNAGHINSIYPHIGPQRARELLREATVITHDASIRDMINIQTEHAWRRRTRTGDTPNVGEIAEDVIRTYTANPDLMRRGKKVFAQLRLLLQRELKTHARLEAPSAALAVPSLATIAREIWTL